MAVEGAHPDRVCLGAIAGGHGVAGVVRIRSFTTEPADVAAYGPVSDEDGKRVFEIEIIGAAKGVMLARIPGVGDRDGADALKGTRLYVAREVLPAPDDDEFYHGDLLGLVAELVDGTRFGVVIGIRTVGETDVLEITRDDGGPSVMVPFTRDATPVVDLAAGRIVIDPPAGLIDDEVEDEAEDKTGDMEGDAP
jgi:16S rRNA processing protein RimM